VSVVSPLSTAAAAPATPATGLPATIAGNHGSRTSFVRKPQVRESDLTRGILDAIWPYYDRRDIVIGGYLSPDEQVWKVNYHWELALWVCDRALNLALPPAQKARFATIGERLRAHAPVPASGYLNDPEPGLTRDSTGVAAQTERYRVLDAAKDELAALIRESGARQKVDGATRARFVLAVQNVLPPGSVNKHGRGYSLDIKGDNARIVRVSRSLGATETYVEEHHVHVEFANGVTLPGAP
jgi:hypothetical protein